MLSVAHIIPMMIAAPVSSAEAPASNATTLRSEAAWPMDRLLNGRTTTYQIASAPRMKEIKYPAEIDMTCADSKGVILPEAPATIAKTKRKAVKDRAATLAS